MTRIFNILFLTECSALFVAASTRCFPNLSFTKSLQKLADLDYHSAEITVGSDQCDLRHEWIAQDLPNVVRMCAANRQITPDVVFLNLSPQADDFNVAFERCIRLCEALRAIALVVKAAPVGSPFNEEFERLRKLSLAGVNAGVALSVLTERDAISGSIDSLLSLCNALPRLSVALDPSHFIYDCDPPINFDAIIPRVGHVRLRDTTTTRFQVQVGQGQLDYNKLVGLLYKSNYRRALCVDLAPTPNVDTEGELRKIRLLIESNL